MSTMIEILKARMARRWHIGRAILVAPNNVEAAQAAFDAHKAITVYTHPTNDAFGRLLIELCCSCGETFYLRDGYVSQHEGTVNT